MVVDPSERERARRMLGSRHRAGRGAARRILDARLRPHVRRRRRAPRRPRRRRLDLQRLGRPGVGDVAATPRDRALRRRADRAPSSSARSLVNEGGGIHVDGEGTVLAHRDGAARPAPQPVRRQGARRGRARPHDRRDPGHLAAARPHPRLRRLRHATATSTSSRPSRRPARCCCTRSSDPEHPDFAVSPRPARAARRRRRMPRAAAGTSSTCPRRRPCATRRASSTGATSTTSSSTTASSPAASARSARTPQAPRDPRRGVYPGRRVVTVDARPIFARGGGIHCITQQQPALSGRESADTE